MLSIISDWMECNCEANSIQFEKKLNNLIWIMNQVKFNRIIKTLKSNLNS